MRGGRGRTCASPWRAHMCALTGSRMRLPAAGACARRAYDLLLDGDGRRLLDAARKQRFARDHEALDLGGALVQLHDLGVAEELLDGVVLDEAVAAVDLHGFGCDLHRGVGREALGVRG